MRTSSRPSSKKCSSPSTSIRSLSRTNLQEDELVFQSFYPQSNVKDVLEELETPSCHELQVRFEHWKEFDEMRRPTCCLAVKYFDKCESCIGFYEEQRKIVGFAVARICDKLKKLVSPHLTIRKLKKSSLIFSNSQITRNPEELEAFLGRLVFYMQMWDDRNNFGAHSNLGLYCLLLTYEHIARLMDRTLICLTNFNVFNFVATGMVVACKYIADDIIQNKWWSEVVEIDHILLNKLEREYFSLLGHNVDIPSDNLKKLYYQIIPNLDSILEQAERRIRTQW